MQYQRAVAQQSESAYEAFFTKVDVDRSGGLSTAELAAHGGDAEAFTKIDSDGSGEISFAEFMQALHGHFDKLDADHSGAIEQHEYPNAAMAKADKDESGSLNLLELFGYLFP